MTYRRPCTSLTAQQPIHQSQDDQPLRRAVSETALRLEPLSRHPHVIRDAEDPIEHADLVARRILGLACPDRRRFEPVIDLRDETALERPLDVAEENDPRDLRLVLGPVDE